MTLLSKTKAALPAMALALVLAPAAVFAHNDDSAKAVNSGTISAQVLSAMPFNNGAFIGGNGSVLVRGAMVQSVSGSAITAKSSWSSASITWGVNTTSATSFYDSRTDNAALVDIKVGDTVSFAGTLNATQGGFTVDAQSVRDWSFTPATTTAVKPIHPSWPIRFWTNLKAGLHLGNK